MTPLPDAPMNRTLTAEELAPLVWAAVYPDRRPWSELTPDTQAEWRRFVSITMSFLPLPEASTLQLRAALTAAYFDLLAQTRVNTSFSRAISQALNDTPAPTHHPDIGAPARKPLMPQERIAWLGRRARHATKFRSLLQDISDGFRKTGATYLFNYFQRLHWNELAANLDAKVEEIEKA